MFGIGPGEFLIIGVVLLLAVGPDKMPTFFRTVGRSLRAFRRTTRELKSAVGFDELLRDEPRSVPRPVSPRKTASGASLPTVPEGAFEAEHPKLGVDVAHGMEKLQEDVSVVPDDVSAGDVAEGADTAPGSTETEL